MTAKTKTKRFKRLISHGFFAPELPPCFVSEDLARYRESIWQEIEAIPSIGRARYSGSKQFISEPSWFYFPRFGRNDRKHGVINPISYLAIARTISDNFVNLRGKAGQSGISTSPLVFDWNGSRAVFRPSIDLRDDFRIKLATRRERYAEADIRAFFHSVYTHAIPWAIHGKTWAKQNRNISHYGNLLDLYCRNAQDGQTIGLPVGPDTSRLISEVVASAVDVELKHRLNISSGDASRYVDDYTVGVDSGHTGEAVISAVRQAAAVFELELNNDKSQIYPTSRRFNIGWKQAILNQVPRAHNSPTEDFLRFFYEIGRVCSEIPDVNVEKYALQNARSSIVHARDWPTIQSHLINAYRRNASLVSFLVEATLLRQAEHRDVDIEILKRFLEARLPELAIENRTGEITWLLFLSTRLEIQLRSTALDLLFSLENSFIALLVTYAASQGLIHGSVNSDIWSSALTSDGLHSQMWLYAYESVKQGINTTGNSNFIQQNQFFAPIYRKNISFFSINTGFTSVTSALRSRWLENLRTNRLRHDFSDDFEFELEEFDDNDEENYAEDY